MDREYKDIKSYIDETSGGITTVMHCPGPGADEDDDEEDDIEDEDDISDYSYENLKKRLNMSTTTDTTRNSPFPFTTPISLTKGFGPPQTRSGIDFQKQFGVGAGSGINSVFPFGIGGSSINASNPTRLSYPNQYNYYNSRNDINFKIKKLIFCSIFDTIICSTNSWRIEANKFVFTPNVSINSICDIEFRKDVLNKLKKFLPDIIYLIVPEAFFIRLANANSLNIKTEEEIYDIIQSVSGYIRAYVSTYLELSDTRKCQMMIFENPDYRSIANTVKETIDICNRETNGNYPMEQVAYIGINSGSNGYNCMDAMIAEMIGNIDYFDTNVLLLN